MVNFIVAEVVGWVAWIEVVVNCNVSCVAYYSMVLIHGIYAVRAVLYGKIAKTFPSAGEQWCHRRTKPYPLV